VPHHPDEDSKLRATNLSIRRGGNCPNAIEVIRQCISKSDDLNLHLITCLPSRSSAASARILASLESKGVSLGVKVSVEHCIYREGYAQAASSYILRSAATGSRTIVNYNDLPDMSVSEFRDRAACFKQADETWWHFEVSPLRSVG
jgi:ketohexokinase